MRLALAFATMTLLAGPAIADQDFYFSGGGGLSMFDDTADASRPPPAQPGQRLVEASIGGQAFDSNETATELTVGWRANEWLSVELGYTDFGNSGQNTLPVPPSGGNIQPSIQLLPPVPPPPGPIGGFSTAVPVTFFPSAVEVEEWSLAAKFRKVLVSNLSANWTLGITHARFDAEGSFAFQRIIRFNPLETERVDVVYASPGSETGFRYGFGFDWRFNDRLSLDLGYRRHDTKVLDIETVLLKLVVAL